MVDTAIQGSLLGNLDKVDTQLCTGTLLSLDEPTFTTYLSSPSGPLRITSIVLSIFNAYVLYCLLILSRKTISCRGWNPKMILVIVELVGCIVRFIFLLDPFGLFSINFYLIARVCFNQQAPISLFCMFCGCLIFLDSVEAVEAGINMSRRKSIFVKYPILRYSLLLLLGALVVLDCALVIAQYMLSFTSAVTVEVSLIMVLTMVNTAYGVYVSKVHRAVYISLSSMALT